MISIQYNRIHVVKGIKLLCEILAVYAQSPISSSFNPLQPNDASLYLLKTSENLKVF